MTFCQLFPPCLALLSFGLGFSLSQPPQLTSRGVESRTSTSSTPRSASTLPSFSLETARAKLAKTPASITKQLLQKDALSPLEELTLKELLAELSKQDPLQALTLIHQSGSSIGTFQLIDILKAYTAQDPEGAITWFNGHLGLNQLYSSVLTTIYWQWATEDPEAALNHAKTLPPSTYRFCVIGDILERAFDTDPQFATSFIAQETKVSPSLYSSYLEILRSTQHSEGNVRESLLESLPLGRAAEDLREKATKRLYSRNTGF